MYTLNYPEIFQKYMEYTLSEQRWKIRLGYNIDRLSRVVNENGLGLIFVWSVGDDDWNVATMARHATLRSQSQNRNALPEEGIHTA